MCGQQVWASASSLADMQDRGVELKVVCVPCVMGMDQNEIEHEIPGPRTAAEVLKAIIKEKFQ